MISNAEIINLKQEIKRLREDLAQKEKLLHELQKSSKTNNDPSKLSTEEIVRYSRQMIMPEVTIEGQESLRKSKVLIVGIGGLGCPAALYLASAGIGELTLIDYDTVELSNLHRQILHFEDDIDIPKVESAFNKLKRINSSINIIPIQDHVSGSFIEQLMKKTKFDVVIDGSDNVATRYLLNDVCVLNNIPLVSGSALQMEGQLTVYHYKDGPCYRCLFPVPPPAHTVTNCGDGGVLGPVPGVIGTLQALEAIKILIQGQDILSGRYLVFDGSNTTFRNVKLRPRNPKCDVCGDTPTISGLIDYEQFCGAKAHDKVVNINIVNPEQEIEVTQFCELKENSLVIDVRPELEFKMCSLPKVVNYPYTKILKNISEFQKFLDHNTQSVQNAIFICRRGNDSQRALTNIQENLNDLNINLYHVKGGLHSYAKNIDPLFPVY